MSDLVRLTRHPADPECVLVDIPVSLNVIAAQLPARLAPDLHAYVMHHDSIPGLYRWGKHNNIHIVDDRGNKPTGPTASGTRSAGPECANCQQPGSATSPPRICPNCGQPWTPVVYRDGTPGANRTACGCGHRQSGRFPYCERCGTAMVYPKRGEIPAFITQHAARPRLDDPMPLGQAVAEMEVGCKRCFRPTSAGVAGKNDGRCQHCGDHPSPDTEETP